MRDLSHPLTPGMMVYPGDPEFQVAPVCGVEHGGVAVTRVGLGTHTGTHVDAPAHILPTGRTLDEYPLDELVGEALVLRARDFAKRRRDLEVPSCVIDEFALGLERFDSVPHIVFIDSGWARHFGAPQYLDHPWLAQAAAERLVALGMRVLGVDTLSPDPGAAEWHTPSLAVHEVVLGAGGLIVENLRGLDELGEREQVGIFPLPVTGGDAAPARVVAFT